MDDNELDLIFKALSDRTRRRIIHYLSKCQDQSLFEVCSAAVAEDGKALARQTVSQHLEVLEAAGLIKITWKGRTKAHSLNIEQRHVKATAWLSAYQDKGKPEQ
ncbi:helix-turn-helix transcriptional regulator [Roseibium sp. SCPC15]|uniref:ArsR/SmtB family transcription factor n=1 Tax=Roseibium sp. SCP15 TaxID=3141376 RepID=UPI00333D758F